MQAVLETAVSRITGENASIDGSGRTDAGAHAYGQIIAFSTVTALPVETLCRAMNANLPFDIAVSDVSEAPLNFHPRVDASSRTYRYLIWNRSVRSPYYHGRSAHIKEPLNEHLMSEALALLLGRHDLGAFVPIRQTGSRERTIFSASCRRDGDLVIIEIEASGFMRQMVRSIVGTAIWVGTGAIGVPEFGEVLKSADRKRAGDTAPACGLYLIEVAYSASHPSQHAIHPAGELLVTDAAPVPHEEKS